MSLVDKKVRDTYKGVLILNDQNDNISSSIQVIKDGDTNNTALGLATNDVQVTTPGGDTFTMPASAASSGQVLVFGGDGNALLWATPVQSFSELNNDLNLITENSAQTLVESYGYLTEASADSRFTTSAQVNSLIAQAALSADIDLSQYVTQASAEIAFGFSALSQFNNDLGYVTEDTATSVISQLVNDAGYITGSSADSTYVTQGDLSALSQFNNDLGYVTGGSADSAYLPANTPTGVSYTSVIEHDSSVFLSADVVGSVIFASSNAILTIAQDSAWNPGDKFTIIAETSGVTVAGGTGISLVNNPVTLDIPYKEVLVIAKTSAQFVFVNV